MKTLSAIALSIGCLVAGTAHAAATADEIKRLGTTLTEFGAESAANADGSIPAYAGGLKGAPAGYVKGSGKLVDPFASEKPILTIDQKNVDQFKDSLTAGTIETIRKYPTFKVNVYPSHRTAVYPKWVLEATRKNAASAELIGAGDGVKGAYAGIPFPIPKNGLEVLWNFFLRWQSVSFDIRNMSHSVDEAGNRTFLGDFNNILAFPYYNQSKTAMANEFYQQQLSTGNAPSSQVGYNIVLDYSIDYTKSDQLVWVYTPGQRRVRTAPEFSYDTPAANFGGALTYDEVFMYTGRPDRYDFKLVGKKDVYTIYNNYRINSDAATEQAVLTAKHPNPDFQRWEKHRVWVVEATLKQGKRHILPRRTFYFDEDSWVLVATDGYDSSGKLYRVGLGMPLTTYDGDSAAPSGSQYFLLDLNKGSYFQSWTSSKGYIRSSDKLPDMGIYTPARLGTSGVR